MNDIDMKTDNVDRVALKKIKSRGGMWYLRQWKNGKVKDTSLGTTDEQEAR